MSNLQFKQLAPSSDANIAAEVLGMVAQAMTGEGMGLYLTRRSPEAAVRLWHEWLRLLLAASTQPASPQIYYLSDLTTAAVVQRWPEDRAGWHRGAALLRLAKLAPWGKWRALRETLVALDRQKAAFLDSHGPFLHLAALGTAADFRGAGLGSMLLDHVCRAADAQRRCVYAEATSDGMRAWLRRQGFFELLRHSVRPHAPALYIMVRQPAAAMPTAALPAAAAPGRQELRNGGAEAAAAAVAQQQQQQLQGHQQASAASAAAASQQRELAAEEAAAAPSALRPAGSVRSR